MCGQLFLCAGSLFWTWPIVPVCGHLSSYMGGRFCTWVVICECGQLFLNVGDQFWTWAISFICGWSLALVGSLLCMGSLSCVSAGTKCEKMCLPCFTEKNDDEQQIFVHHQSFAVCNNLNSWVGFSNTATKTATYNPKITGMTTWIFPGGHKANSLRKKMSAGSTTLSPWPKSSSSTSVTHWQLTISHVILVCITWLIVALAFLCLIWHKRKIDYGFCNI